MRAFYYVQMRFGRLIHVNNCDWRLQAWKRTMRPKVTIKTILAAALISLKPQSLPYWQVIHEDWFLARYKAHGTN
jgi:hypothetical protein